MQSHICERDKTFKDWGMLSEDPYLHTYGISISEIVKIEGIWYAHNSEYSTAIKFCPFCGIELD